MCGFARDSNHICQCAAQQLQRYRARVSGPLLDRIDIHVEVPPVRYAELADDPPAEPSSAIRQRVSAARERQQARFACRHTHSTQRRHGGARHSSALQAR